MKSTIEKLTLIYKKNPRRWDITFFLSGVLIDILTFSPIDEPWVIIQQTLYLTVLAVLLISPLPIRLAPLSQPVFHFLSGSLLSLYSLFFIKSASFATSSFFVLTLLSLLILNESERFRSRGIALRNVLFTLCLLCFLSLLLPTLMGTLGWISFFLTCILTLGVHEGLIRWGKGPRLRSTWVTVLGFAISYFLGWIPPVPLSIEKIGIYHGVDKKDGQYVLKKETPSWKIWSNGDENFIAREGDSVFIFARIYAPKRFTDQVFIHWELRDPKLGWTTTDRIPLEISGGRLTGYRAWAKKSQFQSGHWRVKIETTNHKEIGRIGFQIDDQRNSLQPSAKTEWFYEFE